MKANEISKGKENLNKVEILDVTTTKSYKKGGHKVDVNTESIEKEKTPLSRVYDYATNSQKVIFIGLCAQIVESWKAIKANLKSSERIGLLRDYITARNLSDNFTLQLERIPTTNENGEKSTLVGCNWVSCKVSTLAGIRSIINDAKLQLRRERMTAKKEINSALYDKASKLLGLDRAKVDTLGISTVKDLIAKLG